jgi:hypothetical protein
MAITIYEAFAAGIDTGGREVSPRIPCRLWIAGGGVGIESRLVIEPIEACVLDSIKFFRQPSGGDWLINVAASGSIGIGVQFSPGLSFTLEPNH